MPKIISLLAGATETVCSLGLTDQLIGRAHECDYPAFVQKLPVCSDVNIPVDGSSADIDRKVKNRAGSGHSIYKVNASLIKKLNPDIIITQSHCRVCAVSKADLDRAFGPGAQSNYTFVTLQPNRLSDVWSDIRDIAAAAHVPKQGEQLIQRLQKGMSDISSVTQTLEIKPTVASIEWIDPLMASGNWIPELIDMAGGKNVFGRPGELSPRIEWRDIVKRNPDIILISPCGFDLERTRNEIGVLTERKEWLELNAVVNNRVFLTDGNQFFNRPGPRLLESLEMMAEIFHPGLFHFGHQNNGWEYCGVF